MDTVYLRFIDAILISFGKVKSNDFKEYFGVSRQCASKAINRYLAKYPDNMTYKAAGPGSCYERSDLFDGQELDGWACEYLEALRVVFKPKLAELSEEFKPIEEKK
ncbi:hypothetical protein ABXV18_26960 [Vibrio owensii]|uniref:hypothetical protein n=1 Tax=Vibrio owensii TaxID=696485 RepID=UPI0033989DF4